MQTAIGFVGGLTLTAVLALCTFAQATMHATSNVALASATQTQAAKPAKSKKTVAPKSDSEIQSCIESKLSSAPKIKDQGFSVSVSNGVATFTGTANNGSSKGGVQNIAKNCGAKHVVNNITVQAAANKTGSTKSTTKPTSKP
jgi:osmotically-inducible protein OsmY